ncbi:unnamed protein product [Arctia plantaginis]|uniref:Uncharacterized protein n=1 Tax=Arctia plantaginis TaxID=874455 RepID=A0A8S1A1N6_ARCPL|nr:unnamed protein product [Arctia plantaginis]
MDPAFISPESSFNMASSVTCVLALLFLFGVFSSYEGAPQFGPYISGRQGPGFHVISPRHSGFGHNQGPGRLASGGSISISKSVSISRGGSSVSNAKSSAGSNSGFGGGSSASSNAAASSRGK